MSFLVEMIEGRGWKRPEVEVQVDAKILLVNWDGVLVEYPLYCFRLLALMGRRRKW